MGKISQSVDAASTCKSGDVIYAYITYSGQSSETVAIGYVLGLKDTSTSIAILGTSSETITLTGVGFTFNVSNEELGSWAGVDAHTLRVTLSSDTCSGRATTISNVASSTTLVTASVDFQVVTVRSVHPKCIDDIHEQMRRRHGHVSSSTVFIGINSRNRICFLPSGHVHVTRVKAVILTRCHTARFRFCGLNSDYTLTLNGCENGTHNFDSIVSDSSATVTIDPCTTAGTVLNGSLKHVPTGVQTDVVGIATVGLCDVRKHSLPAANSNTDTFDITLSGSDSRHRRAYVACLSGDGCVCMYQYVHSV